MKKFLLVIIIALVFIGCGTTTHITDKTETIIKHDTIKVAVPTIEDTLQAKVDTVVIHAEKIVGQDTVIQIKYFPQEKKIYFKAKPDTIFIPKVDTIQINHNTEIKEEPSFWEKNFWYIIIILAAVIVIIILIKKKE